MVLTVIVLLAIAGTLIAIWWRRKEQARRLLEAHTIMADELYMLLQSETRPGLYDIRQPLDLLVHSEIIPGAKRITPKEILADPSLISKEVDAIVYCTCPGDKTAIDIVKRALSLDFVRIRLLKGGLDAWKEKGFATERYDAVFHLDTPA